jgi:hypothetical protein
VSGHSSGIHSNKRIQSLVSTSQVGVVHLHSIGPCRCVGDNSSHSGGGRALRLPYAVDRPLRGIIGIIPTVVSLGEVKDNN